MEMDARLRLANRVLRKIREAPITLADLWRSMRNTKGLKSVEEIRAKGENLPAHVELELDLYRSMLC